MTRTQEKHNWNLEKIYPDTETFEAKKSEIMEWLAEWETLPLKTAADLPRALAAYAKLSRAFETWFVYAHMKRDENTKNPDSQRRMQEATALYADLVAKAAHLRPSIMALPEDEVKEVLAADDMAEYRIFVDRILREKAHTLTEAEEKILATVNEADGLIQNNMYLLQNADMDFPVLSDGTKLTQSNFISQLEKPDRAHRQEAFKAYYSVYRGLRNTLASSLYGHYTMDARVSKLRHFDSARRMYLFEEDADPKVYDALLEAVEAALPDLQEYYRVKGAYQGIDDLHMYDVYLPLETDAGKILYDRAAADLLEAVGVLGEEYRGAVKEAFDNRWIDVYPKEGKQSGAYSGGSYETDPFILMNYMDNLDSAFTLAHEMGHSIHSWYSRRHNSYLNAQYTIFVAEVASTFNELLLWDHYMKKAATKEEKLPLINHLLNSFKSTVFRQTMFATFEKEAHGRVDSGVPMAADDFEALYIDLNRKYFGEAVVSDPEIALEYARIPHFYRSFYVYKYATGFLSSVILSRRILDGEPGALEKYLAFLKDGGKHFPLDQLKAAGVDLTDPAVIAEGMEVFKDTVKEFKRLTQAE